jgi:hypothetical protein
MSAPTDRLHDPNSLSFYAPKGPRTVRLSEVSEAAAALAADRHDRDAPPVQAGAMFEGDLAIKRLRARRSLDPDLAPAPPLPPRGSWFGSIGRLTLIMVTAAVVALVAIGQLPFPSLKQKQASLGTIELASSASTPVQTNAAKRADSLVPQLIVHNLQGRKGEPAPLGMTMQGQGDGAVVMISGLLPGMTLSTGSAVGADAWQIPASELANAWIFPPKDFVGAADLMAELRVGDHAVARRRPIRLDWVAPQPDVAPQREAAVQRAVTAPRDAAPRDVASPEAAPRDATLPRPLRRDEISVLVERGKRFIGSGDLAAARLVLQRAAEADDAEGALALAATYDPLVLRELNVYGIAGDPEQARIWYEKAKALGSPEAPRRLELLASNAR